MRDLPTSVDWRTEGVVPPVENQGECGNAVAFQVVHAVDSLNAIETGKLELASVEEYVDCCMDGSCMGGLYGVSSYTCIVKIGGLALESMYVSPEHKCLSDEFKPAIKINGGEYVIPRRNETELAYAVAQRPVVAAIDASHTSFQLYQGGVYYEPDCSSTEYDTVVLVVGYGATESGEEYWICQNSWGEFKLHSLYNYTLKIVYDCMLLCACSHVIYNIVYRYQLGCGWLCVHGSQSRK